METGLILVVLFMASCLYTVTLEWSERRWRFVSRMTWLSVVLGTGMVLAALYALLSWDAWLLVALAFIVAGLPVVGRSLLNDLARDLALESKINDRP
jgi:hypothetical protein